MLIFHDATLNKMTAPFLMQHQLKDNTTILIMTASTVCKFSSDFEKSQVNHWKPTNPKLTEGCLLNTILMPWNKIIPLICSDLLTKPSACFYNQTGLSQTLSLTVEKEQTV